MRRGFNKTKAVAYLGVGRRFFDASIMPLLEGKGTRAGAAIVFERADLDAAWDKYKLIASGGHVAANSVKPSAAKSLRPVEDFESLVARMSSREKTN